MTDLTRPNNARWGFLFGSQHGDPCAADARLTRGRASVDDALQHSCNLYPVPASTPPWGAHSPLVEHPSDASQARYVGRLNVFDDKRKLRSPLVGALYPGCVG